MKPQIPYNPIGWIEFVFRETVCANENVQETMAGQTFKPAPVGIYRKGTRAITARNTLFENHHSSTPLAVQLLFKVSIP